MRHKTVTSITSMISIILLAITMLNCEEETTKAPVACMEADKQTAFVGQDISFSNCSENATAYYWEFGDGATSVEYSPSHSWDEAGSYDVTLQALAGEAADVKNLTITIEPDPAPVACFELSSTSVKSGDTIAFTSCAEQAENYSWQFGDGATSTMENPRHAYDSAGTYTVSLTVDNQYGSDQTSKEVNVLASGVLLQDSYENYEDFSLEFGEWTQVDNDEAPTYGIGSADYPNFGYVGSFIIFTPSQTDPALTDDMYAPHRGDKYAACFSAKNVPNNDDWLISPEVTLGEGYSLTVYVKRLSGEYGPDYFQIQAHEGSTVHWLTPEDEKVEPTTEWQAYTYDLSALNGKTVSIHFGCLSEDAYALMVDDFVITDENQRPVVSQGFEQGQQSPGALLRRQ